MTDSTPKNLISFNESTFRLRERYRLREGDNNGSFHAVLRTLKPLAFYDLIRLLDGIPSDSVSKMLDACSMIQSRLMAIEQGEDEYEDFCLYSLKKEPCCSQHVWNSMADHSELPKGDPNRPSDQEYDRLLDEALSCHLTVQHVAHEFGVPELIAELTELNKYFERYGTKQVCALLHDRPFTPDLGL